MLTGSAYPEFQERNDVEVGTWEVRAASVARTDITNRTMLVPLGDDPHSRAVRTRELMRAKVSPTELYIPADMSAGSGPLLEACETVRLNALLRHQKVKHDADSLDTRGIATLVDRALASRDINTLVDLTVRHHGTKAGKTVGRAIKDASDKYNFPAANEYFKSLRRVIRYQTSNWNDSWTRTSLADTDPLDLDVLDGDGEETQVTVPWGYRHTTRLAKAVESFLNQNGTPQPGESGRSGGATEVPGANEVPEAGDMPGGFAPLRLQHLPKPERVAGRMGRKRSATNVGINPRRIHRYLVDPEKRIFDRRIRGLGGVILIDQSGSMSLSDNDIWDIIKASPGATIIGYSHRPGSGNIPNCWVLAENGKVVDKVRPGNGGNGVDGPALLFALGKRKKGDPFIWVCDGVVTDSNDASLTTLTKWCAKVVANHKIHMVNDVPEAVEALKQVRDGRVLPMRATGPIESTLRWS